MKTKQENFATKLKRLFKEKRKPDGSPYTQTEVVESLRGVVTRVYLWRLMTGRAVNPGYLVVKALAEFFGEDPSYFFVNEKIHLELAKGSQKRDQLINQIALRSSELDNEGKKAVLYMIESIVKSKK